MTIRDSKYSKTPITVKKTDEMMKMENKELDLKLEKFEEELDSFYNIMESCESYVSQTNLKFHDLEDLRNEQNIIDLGTSKAELTARINDMLGNWTSLFSALDEYDKELTEIMTNLKIWPLEEVVDLDEYEALYHFLNQRPIKRLKQINMKNFLLVYLNYIFN